MDAKLIYGGNHRDYRGNINYNNNFDAAEIKRIYTIENDNIEIIRAWQGHRIEQRWFTAVAGSFIIRIIKIDNWENPSKQLMVFEFVLKHHELHILQVPAGYVTSIKALEKQSKLLVMADYHLNEIQDEYRFPSDYFKE